MSANRGRPLELAIGRAARAYRRERRCMLVKQQPQTSTGPDGMLIYSGHAPIDFIGAHFGGRSLALEAKSTAQTAWPIDDLREDQQTAMEEMHSMGADVRLVVAFDRFGETYAIDWPIVAAFLAAPWRKSFTPAWCRAFGLLVPESDRADSAKRRCLFLDARAHEAAGDARQAVHEEQQRVAARPVRVEPEQEDLDLPPAPYVPPTEEERRRRIMSAVAEGIDRQLANPKQRFSGRRR